MVIQSRSDFDTETAALRSVATLPFPYLELALTLVVAVGSRDVRNPQLLGIAGARPVTTLSVLALCVRLR